MFAALQTVATYALGGTGGCDPSTIQACPFIIFGGTGGCEPSNIQATATAFGGTGGCEPSSSTNLGGTGGCDPSAKAAKPLCPGALPGTTLAARPNNTKKNTTAVSVRFVAISSVLGFRRV